MLIILENLKIRPLGFLKLEWIEWVFQEKINLSPVVLRQRVIYN